MLYSAEGKNVCPS